MIIAGLKLTHDGGIAVIENGRLAFSIEMEKLGNNPRYERMNDLDLVEQLLAAEGLAVSDISAFAVDGWYTENGRETAFLDTRAAGTLTLEAAPYHEKDLSAQVIRRYEFGGLRLAGRKLRYASYHHATDHLLSAYCTSPFAARGESALGLVWDGGMLPRLYEVQPNPVQVKPLGPLFPYIGNVFSDFCTQFEPFAWDSTGMTAIEVLRRHLGVAGKAMAYAALGRVEEDAFPLFEQLLDGINTVSMDAAFALARLVKDCRDTLLPGLTNADLIATLQGWLGRLLRESMRDRLARLNIDTPPNLFLVGGCALNIKWNSELRSSGLFRELYVPPFPNDSGAAIGAACSEMVRRTGGARLEWDVYSGPALGPGQPPVDWTATPCSKAGLAEFLHSTGEPVIVLHGRAELGPRALGNRSILAAATDSRMKDHLNAVKGRESYRPVAPICLEDRASEIFSPGSPDPFMLFDHQTRPGWVEKIPAVIHLDGTARLQTVNIDQNLVIAEVLAEYERRSGIPVLCNTSANYEGRGFFPDIASAAEWGRVPNMWSDGTLYRGPAC